MKTQFEPAPIHKMHTGVVATDEDTPFYLPDLSHPGEILKEDLESLGWTQKDLAEIMGRPEQAISEIINGTKQITPETSIELGKALGQAPDYWLRLETNYRLELARGRATDDAISSRARAYSLLPVREVLKRGWLPPGKSLEERVCNFFELKSIWDEPALAASLRTAAHRGPEASAVTAWLRRVEVLAQDREVSTFDGSALKKALPDIAAMSVTTSDIADVPNRLAELGVTLMVVPHLSKSFLDGGTLWVEGSPVVALTCRYNRVDNFWFTLMHELAHVVLGHTDTIAENLDDAVDSPRERAANKLANQVLLDNRAYAEVTRSGSPNQMVKAALEVAERSQRHPGIVIGRLQHDQLLGYDRGRAYLDKVREHVTTFLDGAA
jgi:HTH-type transcriptional regulator / antitoxin HigA